MGKLNLCFVGDHGEISKRRSKDRVSLYLSDEGFGHSFCYFHHEPLPHAAFKSISGASLSANTSTPLSVDICPQNDVIFIQKASSFESSDSFSSIPLQPIPKNSIQPSYSAPIPKTLIGSGPNERGFLSGPIERSFISGPLESLFDQAQYKPTSNKWRLLKNIRKLFPASMISPVSDMGSEKKRETESSIDEIDDELEGISNVQWAHGKAGEDRVHMVISEEDGWVFVGIYDGFNGPDATDYLLSNLYSNIRKELKEILCETPERDTDFYLGREDLSRKRQKKSNFDGDVGVTHRDVLHALSAGLRRTEESFLEIADLMLLENPELSLMGSCVLVMMMRGEDVYLMNVGDSRAIIGNYGDEFEVMPRLTSIQLTQDHSTSVEKEVRRIRREHQDDVCAITNDRVKGSLKVTRAFGAGFLKGPKWNSALLEMFRIDYIGSSPYINCIPSLYHHRLGPKDKFLVLSSDGLYQYFTNEEAIMEIENFISQFPEGDPAQHLIEEVLFRAAKKAGMDFHELLDIPQGDRRKYHDDMSVIIVSFEGRVWESAI